MSQDAHVDLFRTIADATYDWETFVDAQGEVCWINPALERITGHSIEACRGRADYPLFLACDDDRALLARVLADAAAGGSGNDVEFRVRHRDGTLRWVAISWQAVRTKAGAHFGYRTSIRDIDERKRIEAELHVMRRRAEAAVIARSELLANVSHELRSPVHCIAGFAELLTDGPLDAAQRRYVDLIARECTSMARHVEDLLQLAAVEAGGATLARSAFDLEELVRGVVEGERLRAAPSGIALTLDARLPARWVEGDALRVGQVLRNLVDNALKFTEAGSVRVIARSSLEGGDARIEIEVHDTGSGMDAGDVARLMEPFQQATGTSTRRHGGVGLGLSIVQRLVAAMRGSLRIDSTPGQGTQVSVSLRLSQARPAERATDASHPRQHGGERALVVDDSGAARELLRAQLERAGYEVTEAASGREALAHAARARFDLVLLDYQMPSADGAETALALQRVFAAQKHKPRLYLLTANVFVREQLAGARWAFDGILEKPVSREALSALLAREVAPRGRDVVRRTRLCSLLDLRVVEDLRTFEGRDGAPLLARSLKRIGPAQAETLDLLEQAARAADRVALSQHAHALAGHAAMLGARAVARRARGLEQRAASADLTLETSLAAVRTLRAAWARALEALASFAS